MPSVFAIISKAQFEEMPGGKTLQPGQVFAVDRYTSTNRALAPLEQGGSLFLVTVRPPDEKLWMVGVLDRPSFNGKAWVVSRGNTAPTVDLGPVMGKLKFQSGSGIKAKKGTLGMALQTPRGLTDEDEQLLRSLIGGKAGASAGASVGAANGVSAPTPKHKEPVPAELKAKLQIDAWSKLKSEQKDALLTELRPYLRGFQKLHLAKFDDLEIGQFFHTPTAMVFHLVPGGRFRMGLLDEDLKAIKSAGEIEEEATEVLESGRSLPVHEVTVPPFLLSASPIGGEHLKALEAGVAPPGAKERQRDFQKLLTLNAEKYLKYLRDAEANVLKDDKSVVALEKHLEEFGLRLPSEAEWEYAARAGVEQPFPTGSKLPKDPGIGLNRFGFLDMGAQAEVLQDDWHPNYKGAPTDGSAWKAPSRPKEGRVIRGGAASCYPWQGCGEWTMLLSSSRDTAKSMEGFLTIRPVRPI
jgi:formylglycine-generating enzyme required for sulfatase activity